MFSFDFSDDEVCSKFLVSIGRLLLVIFGYQESFLVNFISFIGKVSFVFRILKYVNKVKFFGIYTESKKVVKQDSGIQENKENQTIKKSVIRRVKVVVNQELVKVFSGELVKSRGRRKVIEKLNVFFVNQKSVKIKDKICVYDFDEKDL